MWYVISPLTRSLGQHRLDDLLDDVLADLAAWVTSGLCCVETTTVSMRTGLVAVVLDGDLALAVGAEPVDLALLAGFGQPVE